MATRQTTQRTPWRSFTDETEATNLMRSRNRVRRGRARLSVVVDGPNDGEFTVMDLPDAIDNGFLYRWER